MPVDSFKLSTGKFYLHSYKRALNILQRLQVQYSLALKSGKVTNTLIHDPHICPYIKQILRFIMVFFNLFCKPFRYWCKFNVIW
jgi:hypothetical protein